MTLSKGEKQSLKLHLGCGLDYKAGYLNIDFLDHFICDIVADSLHLPFKSDSAHCIEAYHLIEHFDHAEIRFLLSEWFRVLQTGGILAIETPDLIETFRKLRQSDVNTQETTLQWIYGINDVGMRHKTGFTFSILKSMLEEAGFVKIKKEKPFSHQYEPGLRVVSQKPPEKTTWHSIFNEYRIKIKSEVFFSSINSLILLERNILQEIKREFVKYWVENPSEIYLRTIPKLLYCNPYLALLWSNVLKSYNLIPNEVYTTVSSLILFLMKTEFHKKLFNFWKQRKKTPGKMNQNFNMFLKDVEKMIIKALSNQDWHKIFSYVLSLDPEPIFFFDQYFILHRAQILFNKGIKCFSQNKYSEARNSFMESLKFNPDNFLCYWNLARLSLILKNNFEAQNYYQISQTVSREKKNILLIQEESKLIKLPNYIHKIRKPVFMEQGH
ncbi:MAG: methyltransferase domain-containing protein [Candidatus Hermodarchaeota archaeon]